jgi:hypothetical protein
MVPTYNGWEDSREDEREALEQWEAGDQMARRASRGIPRQSGVFYGRRMSGKWGSAQH